MNESNTLDHVQTLSGQEATPPAKDNAASFFETYTSNKHLLREAMAKHLLREALAPKRPNRNRPVNAETPDQELARITPSNAKLLDMATRRSPPREWYDENDECPF